MRANDRRGGMPGQVQTPQTGKGNTGLARGGGVGNVHSLIATDCCKDANASAADSTCTCIHGTRISLWGGGGGGGGRSSEDQHGSERDHDERHGRTGRAAHEAEVHRRASSSPAGG